MFVKLPYHKSFVLFPQGENQNKIKRTSCGDPITFYLCLHFHNDIMLSRDQKCLLFFEVWGGLVHTEVNHLLWNMISRTKESRSDFRKNIYHKRFETVTLRNARLKIAVVCNLWKNTKVAALARPLAVSGIALLCKIILLSDTFSVKLKAHMDSL